MLATVENSFDGEYHSTAMLHVANSKRIVLFRPASIANINLLLEVLSEFRSALVAEADKNTENEDMRPMNSGVS